MWAACQAGAAAWGPGEEKYRVRVCMGSMPSRSHSLGTWRGVVGVTGFRAQGKSGGSGIKALHRTARAHGCHGFCACLLCASYDKLMGSPDHQGFASQPKGAGNMARASRNRCSLLTRWLLASVDGRRSSQRSHRQIARAKGISS